jgi:hypothetical protein
MHPFGISLGSLPQLTRAKTRSISAENPTGEKGGGARATEGVLAFATRETAPGWKVAPCITLNKGRDKVTIADIEGPGVIQHIWITTDKANWRKIILRFYWDGEETPSIEVPLGDFFAQCWNEHANIASVPIAVNPRGALNCYFPMPFRHARIEVENLTDQDLSMFFYQITYALMEIPEDCGRLHAQFRRTNPTQWHKEHTIVEGIRGQGQYVGTFIGWQANNTAWWGEGELKFYMDGDREYPTICGTGLEDYFGGAWGYEQPPGTYQVYTTPFLGFHQHVGGDGQTQQGRRFGMYRWHVMDPIYFESELRITVQPLGSGPPGMFVPLQDDVCSVAYWYQSDPHGAFPVLPCYSKLWIL